MDEVQAVLSALSVLSAGSDKASFEKANSWLQDFQHSPSAWSTCNILLLSSQSPPAAKLFAAQTFRTKVTYDLSQVDAPQLTQLRDTLISALQGQQNGSKTIIVQLSLALSGLALQFPSWENAVADMIDAFGQNPASVPILLEFLTVLPEETNGNTKIPVSNDEYKDRATSLLTMNASRILSLLTLYISASGVTIDIQSQIFRCLRSWLIAGEIAVSDLANTPLFSYCFEALASDDLFDVAVDVICDLIHETQEIDDNMNVIQLIVPRLIAMRPRIAQAGEDSEKVRGYTRVYSEAGEVYRMLILQHPETFFPIVEAIGECSAYPDLDIVPITFHFWMRLAQSIGKKPSVSPLFINAYKSLMSVIIGHLHFPNDQNTLTGQEAEDFRSFRHVMGDTLKDCCYVLGTQTCLGTVYDLITAAVARGTTGGASVVLWQEIEAPLFSLRSMGAEIDPYDDQIIPKIMDLIPSLPDHPRLRYAAILVISRYTQWTNRHPDRIPFQLQFISSGFDSTDNEVSAAAGQALKFLCQDCKQHLIAFISQLHSFLVSYNNKLVQDDRLQVYEAVAYVISAMPMNQASDSLRTFALDLLSRVHVVSTKSTAATKQELQLVIDDLENLEVLLRIVQGFGEELPHACQSTCKDIWLIFDPFLARYGEQYDIAERATQVLRHGLKLFGSHALSIVVPVLERLSTLFTATGHSSYVWISSKIIGYFGNEEDLQIRAAFRVTYDRSTAKVASLLNQKTPRDLPDVLEDYLHLLLTLADLCPDVLFESPSFHTSFRAVTASLMTVHPDIVFASLDLIKTILTHDALLPATHSPAPKFPIYASAIHQVIDAEGLQLSGLLLTGLLGDFPEESVSSVVAIFRTLANIWPKQLLSWLPHVLGQLPTTPAFSSATTQFLSDMTNAIQQGHPDQVKNAILGLNKFSKKVRERRRAAADMA